MKCKICNNFTKVRSVTTRDGEKKNLNICLKCDFAFFTKDYSHLIIADKFEKKRLYSAGLSIPDIKTDFKNGTKQSLRYIKDFITKRDRFRNVLEIGCSWGYFLKLLKNNNINAMGLEINSVRANYVKNKLGIDCYINLEDIEEKKINFHKIFLFYSIQYIPNPREYLKRLLDLLEVSGTIYLITPNLNDILIRIWQNKYYSDFFFEKMTVSYFSVTAMRRLIGVLKHDYSISYHLETRQGYSFLNHINWYFTEKPRTTGMVGGDKYVAEVSNKISSSNVKLGKELSDCLIKFDKKYRTLIERYGCGNQIILEIKKLKKVDNK